jgi:hypothetical protein
LANKTAAILRGDGTGRELVEAMMPDRSGGRKQVVIPIFQKKFGNYLRIVMLVLKVLLLLSLNQMHHGALP